jgi:hypothetical protein
MMRRGILFLAAAALVAACSGSKQETPAPAAQPAAEATTPAQPAGGPHAVVHLQNGSKVAGTIVASSQTDMTLAGDDGIERKIPMVQVKSVDYQEAKSAPAPQVSSGSAQPGQVPPRAPEAPPAPPAPAPAVTTTTYELPAGSELSVRTGETIDSALATEGQTFVVQVTRDATDVNGDVVIPRGSDGRVVIKSASGGSRFKGAADLVLDLQSVDIGGRQYAVDTADISEQGKQGVGANKRTAKFAGGGAALGALVGAIAGGGKGAAIGAGAGAGGGLLTQVLTKGGSIKVPAESVLTFRLDRPLRVTVQQ